MTSCPFEKDANAEILFDKGVMRFESGLSMERHIRIKIFTYSGKKNAEIRFMYHPEFLAGKAIGNLEAETINLEDNKIVITPLDQAQIYTEKLNKNFSALVFTFPNVKPGSIIEYKFNCYPQKDWFFQSNLPTRYSELEVGTRNLSGLNTLRFMTYVRQPFAEDTRDKKQEKQILALANIHSLPDEPYMTARKNNLQRIEFLGAGFLSMWGSISNDLAQYKGFGGKLDEVLSGEDEIIKKSDAKKNDDERIAFIFDTVKKVMTWDHKTFFITAHDIKSAWDKKTGNSAEINLIVYHFLSAVGFDVRPMVVCTRDYGRIDPLKPDPYALNNTVAYVRIDSSKFYVLDASNKFNLYNTIPYSILDTYGLAIKLINRSYNMVMLRDTSPVFQSVFLNAEIKPNGKMTGTAEITGDSYNKIGALSKYHLAGKDKYLDTLKKNDNNIKISSFEMLNADDDAQPLTQKIGFDMDLANSDDNYIYFNTNIFTSVEDNPFKSEQRFSDIDLGYRNNYSISEIYKLPQGYRTESLPKNIAILMPDQSIFFKRTIAEENGVIMIRYVINHRKTIYFMENYQDLRGFYHKMYELLNEQVVLKKQGG